MAHREGSDGRRRKAGADLNPLARKLRREESLAEKLLWKELRGRRFDGLKFRRQHPIGRHIADFACVERTLAIELDGDTHDETAEKDAARTRAIEALGYRVIRFRNEDVYFRLKGVLADIYDACIGRGTTPSPQPSPPGTGERE